METKDIIQILVSSIAAIIALYALYNSIRIYKIANRQFEVAAKSFIDNHDYAKRQFSINFISKWDDSNFIQARKCINNRWPNAFLDPDDINWNEIKQVRKEELKALSEDGKIHSHALVITDHMTLVLNYFETMAIAIENKVANEIIMKQAFYHTFHSWFIVLSDYREHVNKARKYHPWKVIEKLHDEKWYPSNPSVNTPLDETGKLSG
jgi:hypothetical protein